LSPRTKNLSLCSRMITRSFIIYTLALLLGTSITFTIFLHPRNAYFGDVEHYALGETYQRNERSEKNNNIPAGISKEESTHESTIKSTTNFIFPSRQTRLKYYMGDWFGRTLLSKDISCNEITAVGKVISDHSILWRVSKMEQEIKTNSTRDWLIRAYLVNAFDVINSKGIGREKDGDGWLILFLGDSHSHSTKLPVVAKTRFSRFATARSTGKPFFDTIIWPLEMHRHYFPVNEYIKLEKEGKVCEWEDKKSVLIWRGGVTGIESDKNLSTTYPDGGPRLQVVNTYFNKNISDVDVAFQRGNPSVQRAPYKYRNVRIFVRGDDTSMIDQLKYKYILMLEGNDVATGLKWQLTSNSVVFMARPTTVSFLMEDLLVPFVHYVPLKDDYSNLIDMVHWARRNDKKCQWISEQATLFMQQLWISEEAKRETTAIKKELGETYHRQFGEAVKTCGRS